MATLAFPYDHSRDPMYPPQLGDQIATALNLTAQPDVAIDPVQIVVTHPAITEANRTAIQALIAAYVYDPVRAALPPGNLGALLAKLQQAIAANNTFLALAAPTNAQAIVQLQRLTRQMNALVKLAIGDLADTTGT